MTYNVDLDFNSADTQDVGDFYPIPDDTVVTLIINLRSGGAGDGGWLKQGNPSASSTAGWQMLDLEFTVIGGEFNKRKIWENWMWHDAGPIDAERASKTANITKQKIRAILESARGIAPSDESNVAKKSRTIDSFADLIHLTFMAKVKVDPGRNGYGPKNLIKVILTPGMSEYTNPAGSVGGKPSAVAMEPSANPQGGNVPSWAQSQSEPQLNTGPVLEDEIPF